MINRKTFMNAVGFADLLAVNGVKAVPLPNTVIYDLVRLSNPEFFNRPLDSEDSINLFSEAVQLATNSDKDGLSNHSIVIDNYINDISANVRNHISFAKNTVVPLVKDFSERFSQFKETYSNGELDKYNVVKLYLPELLKDDSFLDTLRHYKDSKPLVPNKVIYLSNKTDEELLSLVSIGHNRTDKLVAEWLGNLDPMFLSSVWVSFFTKEKPVFDFKSFHIQNAFEKANLALAIYLMSTKLLANVEEAEDMDLASYRDTLGQYRDFSAATLVHCINTTQYITKGKVLIIESLVQPYTVKVNGELYDQWLETGGDVEVILGLAISGSDIRNLDLIDQKASQLKVQWNSYTSFLLAKEKSDLVNASRNWINNYVLEYFKDLTKEEKEFVEKNPTYFETVKRLTEQHLDEYAPSGFEDCDKMALVFVAEIRFYYTSAYCILSDMMEIGKINPNVDSREAALFAAINYVSDYVADQITLAN